MTKTDALDLAKEFHPNFVVEARPMSRESERWVLVFNSRTDGRNVYAYTREEARQLADYSSAGTVLRRF